MITKYMVKVHLNVSGLLLTDSEIEEALAEGLISCGYVEDKYDIVDIRAMEMGVTE